jgi:hypothetical protein
MIAKSVARVSAGKMYFLSIREVLNVLRKRWLLTAKKLVWLAIVRMNHYPRHHQV